MTDAPENLKRILQKAAVLLEKHQLNVIATKNKASDLSMAEMLGLAHFLRNHFKQNFLEVVEIYFQLDAWYGMATAVKEFDLVFPEFIANGKPELNIKGLYHILINEPVAYDLELDAKNNFVFLT